MLKSVNLQYNTLVRWDAGTKDSSTKRLMFQALFFFIISYRLAALNTFYFCKFIKKKNLNNYCKEFCKQLWKKNNTWNLRCLVDESFVPANQQTIVLYCKSTWTLLIMQNTHIANLKVCLSSEHIFSLVQTPSKNQEMC